MSAANKFQSDESYFAEPRRRLTQALVLAFFSIFLMFLFGGFKSADPTRSDFLKYYVLSHRLHAGEPIYDPVQIDSHLKDSVQKIEHGELIELDQSKFSRPSDPPPLTLATWPFALLPYSASWWLLCLSSLIIVTIAIYRVATELDFSRLDKTIWVFIALGSIPVLLNGLLNHIEAFVWGALIYGWVALRKGYQIRAGFLWGIAGAMKLFPLALIPMTFAAGYKKLSSWMAATALCAFFLPLLVFEKSSAHQFFYEVLPQSSQFRFSWANSSVISLMSWFVSVELATLLAGLFLTWTIYLCKSHRTADQIFVLGISASLLCSPLCWSYYFILAIPCIMIILSRSPRLNGNKLPFLLATLVYWPGLLGGFIFSSSLPVAIMIPINFAPTLGLFTLWRFAQAGQR
jgi:hypothetical protein